MTLADLLEPDAVPLESLNANYAAPLQLVKRLLGVIPNADGYLEIWPPAFRTYNVLVPNLLNLPFLLWGLGAPRSSIGLAMYVASREAGCAYCAAHACSFALRRGASVDEVATALQDDANLSAADRAVVQFAQTIAGHSTEVDDATFDKLGQYFSPAHAEWIALAVSVMGWLNKAMDALGIPLEAPLVAEVSDVITPSGWSAGKHLDDAVATTRPPHSDSWVARLGVVRHAPAAIILDKRWTRGMPDRWPAVGHYLRELTGHDFPVLARLRHRRAIRAIATAIRENFVDGQLSLSAKKAAGRIYAASLDDVELDACLQEAETKTDIDPRIVSLARGIAASPAQVDDAVIAAARQLSPASVVELVSFIASLQLLHRLSRALPRSPR